MACQPLLGYLIPNQFNNYGLQLYTTQTYFPNDFKETQHTYPAMV